MPKEVISEQIKGKVCKIVCGRCNNTTNHSVYSSIEIPWGNEDIQGVDRYEIIQCSGCDSISFQKVSSDSDDFEQDDDGNLIRTEKVEIYPNRLMGRVVLEDTYLLPERVCLIYKETYLALCTKLKILACVGVRALIEAVCLEKEAKGKKLQIRIDNLVTKGILTKINADILHKTRILGNAAAHDTKIASDSELNIAFDIIENLLKTVYIIPKKAEKLK